MPIRRIRPFLILAPSAGSGSGKRLRRGSRSGSRSRRMSQWRLGAGRVMGGRDRGRDRDRDWGGTGLYSRMQGGSEGAGSRRAIALGGQAIRCSLSGQAMLAYEPDLLFLCRNSTGSARDRLRLPGWFKGE